MIRFLHSCSTSLLPVLSAERSCPLCNAPHLDRTKRRFVDRLLSLVVPLRRYRCVACGWEGNLWNNSR